MTGNDLSGAILFVLNGFAFGGAERLASEIIGHLTRGQRRVVVAAFAEGEQGPDAANTWFAPLCPVVRLDPEAEPGTALLDLIRREDVSVIVLCGKSPAYGSLPRLRAVRPDLRIVSFLFNARQLVREHRIYAAHIDAVIAESFDAAAALALVDDRLPIEVISSGVRAGALAARPRPARSGEPLCVAYVGRFDRSKNPEAFVATARLLAASGNRFVMAGSVPASFRRPRGVEVLSRLSDRALAELMDHVDILVVPSRNDGRPLVLQEAQARGIAVVASRVGAIPELVEHEKTGLLCPPDDVKALAAAVQRLADDPSLRRRLGEAGRERALRESDIGRVLPRYAETITGARETAAAAD